MMTIEDILNKKKINIPNHIKKIRFDIGLSYCAPNSTIWLDNDNETFVIGIEANKYAVERIKKNGFIARQKNLSFPYPHNNFLLLNLAIDNVESPSKINFYHMSSDVGVSSLLKPTEFLGHQFGEMMEVDVIPLHMIIDLIDWDRFEYIELVKIDTQGKDLDIIKSMGHYLKKIVYLNCEVNTFNHYENAPNPYDYDNFLFDNGFDFVLNNSFVDGEVVDKTYLNKEFISLKDKIDYFVL